MGVFSHVTVTYSVLGLFHLCMSIVLPIEWIGNSNTAILFTVPAMCGMTSLGCGLMAYFHDKQESSMTLGGVAVFAIWNQLTLVIAFARYAHIAMTTVIRYVSGQMAIFIILVIVCAIAFIINFWTITKAVNASSIQSTESEMYSVDITLAKRNEVPDGNVVAPEECHQPSNNRCCSIHLTYSILYFFCGLSLLVVAFVATFVNNGGFFFTLMTYQPAAVLLTTSIIGFIIHTKRIPMLVFWQRNLFFTACFQSAGALCTAPVTFRHLFGFDFLRTPQIFALISMICLSAGVAVIVGIIGYFIDTSQQRIHRLANGQSEVLQFPFCSAKINGIVQLILGLVIYACAAAGTALTTGYAFSAMNFILSSLVIASGLAAIDMARFDSRVMIGAFFGFSCITAIASVCATINVAFDYTYEKQPLIPSNVKLPLLIVTLCYSAVSAILSCLNARAASKYGS